MYVHPATGLLRDDPQRTGLTTRDEGPNTPRSRTARTGRRLPAGWTLGGVTFTMTENERRAQDVLTREDVLIRALGAMSMVAMFLLVLLVVNP